MKSIIAAGLLLGMAHGTAAVAGPYVNVENNSGFTGSAYKGNVTEFHVGYEGDLGEDASYYVQAGPAVIAADVKRSIPNCLCRCGHYSDREP